MMKKFPALTEQIRTGAVQFGDDWPGIFIRGDDAMTMATLIELYFKAIEIPLSSHRPVQELVNLLRSCDVNAKAA